MKVSELIAHLSELPPHLDVMVFCVFLFAWFFLIFSKVCRMSGQSRLFCRRQLQSSRLPRQ